jgi:hypothetical protein
LTELKVGAPRLTLTAGAIRGLTVVGAATLTLTVGATRLLTETKVSAAKPTLTPGAVRLLTAIVVGAAKPTLTGAARILSGGVAMATVAESESVGSLALEAVTVTLGGDGGAAGAVYRPFAEMVPTVLLPPIT